jgi:hypothetical protein
MRFGSKYGVKIRKNKKSMFAIQKNVFSLEFFFTGSLALHFKVHLYSLGRRSYFPQDGF